MPEILAAREASGSSDSDTSVIMLYQHGGASQLETYDLQPDAPTSYRSVFNPISTNVPGLDICELFPLQAKLADRFSIVRSLHHDVGIHSDGGIVALTGRGEPPPDFNPLDMNLFYAKGISLVAITGPEGPR